MDWRARCKVVLQRIRGRESKLGQLFAIEPVLACRSEYARLPGTAAAWPPRLFRLPLTPTFPRTGRNAGVDCPRGGGSGAGRCLALAGVGCGSSSNARMYALRASWE
mmetsp:Transcript_35603/g.62933  ORF Transcript_35603/g.62933 Transcript_35603/m.62933 type:complete len:107 (-) Transcript_35603:3036-3356(-)